MPKPKKEHDDDQSDNDQSDDSEKQLVVNTDNSPKIIPVAKLPEKLKNKKIVLNVSDTQYPIVTQIGEQLGWIIQDQQGAGDWDVWWTDREIEPNTLYRMNLHQKINHFPGIYVLARKNLLGLHLMAMQNKFPRDYNFFPQTWMLPMQFHQFRQYYESIDEGKVRTYIVKPEALSQGRGIFLTRSIQDVLNGRKYVVQRYLKNPLLLDGLKFDLRIYVLLAGSQPLRLYIYEQGLARLATRPYQPPTAQNLHQNYIHLTNYSLNKNNPDYVYNKSDKQMDVGHKRSLKGVYERLAKNGIDIEKVKEQIEQCIIKTVISGLPSIRHQYSYCQPQEYEGNMCFHILGFDVMIMDDLKPIIIEVNHTPSFETGTPLDYMIKKNLIKDTLKLMRITQKNKKSQFQKAKDLTKKRIQTGKRDIFKGEQRKQQLNKAQKVRDEEETQILFNTQKPSGYKVIFPFKDQKKNEQYAKFYEGAQKVMKQLKDMRKKIISQQNSSPSTKKQQPNKNGRQSKNSSSTPKQASIERSMNKKPSTNSNSSQKPEQKSTSITQQPSQNMQSSGGNSSSQNDNINNMKKLQLDTILQNHSQHQTITNQIKSTTNTSEVIQTDKKIVYSSINSANKNNFHIRNNKITKKNSFNLNPNQKLHSEDVPHNFQHNKYQQLMSKFVRSKDLDDHTQNRVSLQGHILLEEKFNSGGRKSKNSNHEQQSMKQISAINYYATELREKDKYSKNEIIISSIKGYKQKIVAVTQQQNRCVNEKFHDGHLNKDNRTSKGQRNYASSGHANINFINIVTKPFPIQTFFANMQKAGQQQTIPSSKQKDTKNSKNDMSKLGKFLKPKTYNLHESKFPHEDKFIVRVDPNTNIMANYKPNIQINQQGSSSPNGSLLSFQQYNEFCTNVMNNAVTTQVQSQGYNARTKISINQRNVSQFVNAINKPSTSHKIKSNSMIYKTSNAPKDNPILFKLIQKSKIKGYQ